MPALDGSLFGKGQPCFGCGPDHPHGLRLSFTEVGDEVHTRYLPRTSQQGPPNIMHGGLVFTLADELAAWGVIVKLGKFGFTARFQGKLQKPVRPGTELHGRSKIVRSTGRTAEVHVLLTQEGEPAFDGTFTFAIVDRGAAEKMIGGPIPAEWDRYLR
ncbi:MAG: PaaI family thioesterase [Deltaproteobacteria bacterium]|nr:PaaI family thioesterase [Deltaproteobacteria bacterium]